MTFTDGCWMLESIRLKKKRRLKALSLIDEGVYTLKEVAAKSLVSYSTVQRMSATRNNKLAKNN